MWQKHTLSFSLLGCVFFFLQFGRHVPNSVFGRAYIHVMIGCDWVWRYMDSQIGSLWVYMCWNLNCPGLKNENTLIEWWQEFLITRGKCKSWDSFHPYLESKSFHFHEELKIPHLYLFCLFYYFFLNATDLAWLKKSLFHPCRKKLSSLTWSKLCHHFFLITPLDSVANTWLIWKRTIWSVMK